MEQDKLSSIKNFIWAIFIAISMIAVIFALLFSSFRRYSGEKADFNARLGAVEKAETADIGTGTGNSRGELHILSETADAGEEYINSLTFVVDSTFISLRDLSLVENDRVWGTVSGSLPMNKSSTEKIKFPNDGSEITVASAAMIAKPDLLVLAIGTDYLGSTDEESYITQYDTLIRDIKKASPDTTVICVGLPGVIPDYSGPDGLDVTKISDGNDWVQLVCRDTGSYFLNIQEGLSESVQLLNRYAGSNGKTLNRAGIEEFLNYTRTHALQ